MDRILIRDLALQCVVGIYPRERTVQQDVILNVAMETDLRRAGETDSIDDTIDYKAIKLQIMEFVEQSQFHLIESLAEKTAAICLRDPRVRRVTVTVDKPGALRFARSVAVEVVREQATGSAGEGGA